MENTAVFIQDGFNGCKQAGGVIVLCLYGRRGLVHNDKSTCVIAFGIIIELGSSDWCGLEFWGGDALEFDGFVL